MPVSDLDIGWLAGLFDGEGCVALKKNPTHVVVVMVNTEVALLKRAQSILDALEIDSSIHSRILRNTLGKKPQYELTIASSGGVRHFFSKVPIQSPEKLAKYQKLIPFLPVRGTDRTRARRQRLRRQYPELSLDGVVPTPPSGG